MTALSEDDIIRLVGGMPSVAVVTASEAGGAPEAAWGDSFFFYDPDGDPEDRRMPFATIVTSNYDGFDTASDLGRPGVFRLNVAVGRARFEELVGYPPSGHAERSAGHDYAAVDQLLPHPVYGARAWVSIVNPGERTGAQARTLLAEAHARAVGRHRR
jgi:hypothetical protein